VTVEVILSRAAAADIAEARDWYEVQQVDLGKDFLDALQSTLIRVSEGPERFLIVAKDSRRALVPRFPYSIYFRRQGERVRIIAVLHQNRDPRVWQRRSGG
jgi:plasmid stabilization system protein ParE